MPLPASLNVVQFGVFELDLQRAELRKQGVKVRLQEQPLKVLQVLVENPGQIVSRDQLRSRIWPANTFVEFDQGLYSAMNRLRDALGDSSESPRFIETVARRGYRFIAPVTSSPAEKQQSAIDTQPSSSALPWPRRLHRLLISLVAGLLIGVVLIALFLVLNIFGWRSRHLRSPVLEPAALTFTRITNDGREKDGNPSLGHVPSPFVSDGARLYLTEAVGDHYSLAGVPLEGGETVQLPTPFPNVALADISPSGANILAFSYSNATTAQSPLWIVPTIGGNPRRVGDAIAQDAAWSRDGTKIIYANQHDLLLSNPDGSDIRKIATVRGLPVWPRWSPREDLIRFTQYDPLSGATSLWQVSATGSDLGPLFPDQGDMSNGDCCGVWTPDGRYFLFQSSRGHMGTNIWLIREQRDWLGRIDRVPQQMTAGPLSFSNPVMGRDGKKLLVLGLQRKEELSRYDPGSGHTIPYLGGLSGEVTFHGSRAAWITVPEMSLWAANGDGSERSQLTIPPMKASAARWSPDGKQICFMAETKPGMPVRIYLISSQGGKFWELIDEEGSQAYPDWSPDGHSIVFGGLPAVFAGTSDATSIRVIDLITRHVSQIPGSDGLFFPRWSTDGRYLAAKTADSKQLALFDFKKSKWQRFPSPAGVGSLNWSHDSRYLYFESLFAKDLLIFRLRVSNLSMERFAVIHDFNHGGSLLPWMGLTEEDFPLLLREIGSQEIYGLELQLP